VSMYTRFNTYEEVISFLKDVDDPVCFTVNYLPDIEEYALWIGSQPYDIYDEFMEKKDNEVRDLKKQVKKLEETISNLRWRMLSKVFKINKLEKKFKRGE
jgi:hypothetical protein